MRNRVDAIKAELRQIGKDMGGINPKLSYYQKLKSRREALNNELVQIRKQTHGSLGTTTKEG